MNRKRFNELLDLYLDNKATAAEHDELMELIREGSHDTAIKERIDAMLFNERVPDDIEPSRAKEMLKTLIGKDAEGIVPIQPSSTWRWVAAAAVLVLSVGLGWWTSRPQPDRDQSMVLQEEKVEPVVLSGKQFVHLPDGSTVLLNEGTRLSYASSFGDDAREVILTGEAYFDVEHDPERPFKVLTGKITTTVLGTAFNVRAYPGKGEIKVTVTRGKVQVAVDEHTFGVLNPDQQIVVNTRTNDFVRTELKEETVAAWQSQFLILDNVSLEEAIKTIGEKYNVNITLSNDALKACRITATFLNGEDLDQVLTVVSGVVQATYAMLPDGDVIIKGKGCTL